MRKFLSVLWLTIFMALPGSGLMAAINSPTVILAGNYWDGLSDKPLGYAEIVVVDGKITEIAKKVTRLKDATIIDLSRQFVMPGFIDCHLHLTGNSKVIANFAALCAWGRACKTAKRG